MSLGPTVRALLLADASVRALVADRVHMLIAPQPPVPPFIVCHNAPQPLNDMAGATGATRHRMSVTCWDKTYLAAYAVAHAVAAVLNNRSGAFPRSQALPSVELYDDESTPPLFGVATDFNIWTQE